MLPTPSERPTSRIAQGAADVIWADGAVTGQPAGKPRERLSVKRVLPIASSSSDDAAPIAKSSSSRRESVTMSASVSTLCPGRSRTRAQYAVCSRSLGVDS